MGFTLTLEKTGSTPYIFIDEDKGYMRFEGESFHENVIEFYSDVNKWLVAYLEKDFSLFTFDCELHYFNSSTAKLLLNMLMMMDEISSDTHKIVVNWITSKDNEIIIECGEDFADEIKNLTFQIVIK